VDASIPIRRPWSWLAWANAGVKVALIALLAIAVLNPTLPQFAGKAMAGRALTFPIAAALVPVVWAIRFRRLPYPTLVDLLIVLPFLIDTVGNALNLYDSIDWWDDANHFVNWSIETSAIALLLRSQPLGRLNRIALAFCFAVTSAALWEFAEYVTFIRFSPELQTAYTDTLGDLALGMAGGLLAAVIVTVAADRRSA
jgi:hypothetical protein